ncbi:hypothetical protein JCM31826_19860 [Thermaurantimonas aggregans]|uniref:Right handed beta helix domain-containing protein n=1 Tax=Thermaurantimonas aggregans TaxID=2173829 RepID=A0A401XNB1_9FLAO|nr:hypothetical protein [Thermaurantimonas aggregans]MCX8149621.1 hypothetical protein [Thermaurantimonas aggregans]GCD78504.1 hypothetical protein JCM31826_19860 [Thermaurantimonas aggregans]
MKFLYLHKFLLFGFLGFGQSELNTYLSDWSRAGLITSDFKTAKVVKLSPHADTSVPVNESFESAFKALGGKPGIILLAEGKYLITKTLQVPSNTLIKGMGPGKTVVYINNGGNGHGFSVEGGLEGARYAIVPPKKGDRTIKVLERIPENVRWIRWIREDQDLCKANWCYSMTGQFFLIERRKGEVLYLHDAIRDSTRPTAKHVVAVVQPAENVFFEDFTLIRLDRTSSQSSNFHFNYAVNCRVSGVESFYTNYAHVEARNSAHIEVSGCYFTLSHGYGGGGRGYGTMIHLGSVNCLVLDNTFDVLRHAMITQAGANGNVFAFNYSINPRQTTTLFGIDIENGLTGDMVLHGNYTYANLFEGNRAVMAIADNAHGFSGPNNVFFKNHIGRNGFSVTEPNTHRIALLNNRIDGPVLLFFGQNHLEFNTITTSSIRRPADLGIKNLTSALRRMPKNFQKEYLDATSLHAISLPAEVRYHTTLRASAEYSFKIPRLRLR